MNKKIAFLIELSEKQLWAEFINFKYPKWSTLCLLKYIGLNVLDSLFIDLGTSEQQIISALSIFTNNKKNNKILIRTDTNTEKGNYLRGGNSYEIEDAIIRIKKILDEQRIVIITSPTNRFTNKLSVNFYLDYNGYFQIEALGPGFDVADLNRGIITPEINISISNVNWKSFERPNYFFINKYYHSNIDYLRQLRLNRIATELLPAMGILLKDKTIKHADQWLKTNGFTHLFSNKRPRFTYQQICDWYESCYLIGLAYKKLFTWKQLVISASVLENEKSFVYWDIVNSMKKFSF